MMQIHNIIANSYKDFHTKGLDYICTERTPERTVKYYFFNGDVTKIPEVVNPHDHRYSFSSKVLAGSMVNHVFKRRDHGEVYQAFDYMTPLNGGDGFTYRGEEYLYHYATQLVTRNHTYYSTASDIHTIQIMEDQTVLKLIQNFDYVPLDEPTSCWTKTKIKPDTSGLYSKFKEDEILARLKVIEALDAALSNPILPVRSS